MRTRSIVAIAAAGTLALPVLASADLGPHSSYYESSPRAVGVRNAVGVTVVRPKHRAYADVSNSCLGTYTVQGHTYPDVASLPPGRTGIPIRRRHIDWRGNASLYDQQQHRTLVAVHLIATVSAKKVVGSVTLAGKCGTIRFTAKLEYSSR